MMIIFGHFTILGLAVHLLGKDLIYSLDIRHPSKFPFALMAAEIEILVMGFALHARKKRAV
jgi:hypothetical protein